MQVLPNLWFKFMFLILLELSFFKYHSVTSLLSLLEQPAKLVKDFFFLFGKRFFEFSVLLAPVSEQIFVPISIVCQTTC